MPGLDLPYYLQLKPLPSKVVHFVLPFTDSFRDDASNAAFWKTSLNQPAWTRPGMTSNSLPFRSDLSSFVEQEPLETGEDPEVARLSEEIDTIELQS